jgi:mRNA interferase YafQ
MNSKQKKAKLPRRSDRTKQFEKDWVSLSHSGRYDMRALKDTMQLLTANDGPLQAGYRDMS